MVEAIEDIDEYLDRHQKKELLRFVAVGSVDDGKSTLIGRLLHDTHAVYEDQLAAVERASSQNDMEIDFSLFTDGLKAEREQGITIDVAYRYFSTDKRKFIIADTPGHVQYTRNMATGASTANVGIILIDARLGVLQQSRRHAHIASMLGIPHLAVAVNKMDLRDYDQKVFDDIVGDFRSFAKTLSFKDVTFTPISALKGDNVVSRSDSMPWFRGKTMLEYLETVPIASDRNLEDFRYPVQYVLRPDLNYRGFAAEVASGVVKKGDSVMVLPSRTTTRVAAIDTFSGELAEAFAPMSVTLRLEDEVDVSRGDMIVHPGNEPHVARRFEADVVWMSERPLNRDTTYFIKQTTTTLRAEVEAVVSVTDLEALTQVDADTMKLNDIGRLRICCHRPLMFDAYQRNRSTGAFVLIDPISNGTVAAGMIVGPVAAAADDAAHEGDQARSRVTAAERRERLGHAGGVVWIEGPGAAADRIAYALERRLHDDGVVATVASPRDSISVKGESVLSGAAREEALLQAAERLCRAGVVAIVSSSASPASLPERSGGALCRVCVGASGGGADVDVAPSEPESSVPAVVSSLQRLGIIDKRSGG